ncbi:MAG: YabP/YqfC family sporulation protein [Ruminococcus sp.]|nr:YabP/YqfC family sporulation protein [Ruminococcus sp.]MCD7800885.1 YabP/YqfC family sporulation protein [Ruminococcus sp.]
MLRNIYDKSRQLAYLNTAIHINDDRNMIVENCGKIIEYSDIYIALKTGNLKIFVWGKGLKIDDFDTDCIKINGSIQSVEFSR